MSGKRRLTVIGLVNLLRQRLDYALDQDDAELEVIDADEGNPLFLTEDDVEIALVGKGVWKIQISPSYARRIA